ncbi:MAG: hypothetical protein C4534_03895 [Gaiellales bacterium]|nr:MAG: hypothetical protein C4534_03895 [Gaiellales bacterium]
MERATKAIRGTGDTLSCPNDGAALAPVRASSRQGAVIMLDQCGCCGGIWFDRWELFQVDAKEVKELAAVDLERLRCPAGKAAGAPACPRCGQGLRTFTDPQIPASIQMFICDGCEGVWLNHGEAAGYAEFRQQFFERRGAGQQSPGSRGRLGADYEKMLKASSNREYWQALEQFGHQLGGQRDALTGLPLDGSAAQLARIDEAQDAFYTALGVLARLLFGWL